MKSERGFPVVFVAVLTALGWFQVACIAQLQIVVRPDSPGKLRISALNQGTNSTIVEQAATLEDPTQWSLAPVGLGGAVATSGGSQFYRLRVVPPTPTAPVSPSPLDFTAPPESVDGGSGIQLALTTPGQALPGSVWLVNGIPGGSPVTGFISTNGVYTAPLLASNSVVEIRARAQVSGIGLVEAGTLLTIRSPGLFAGPRLLGAAEGGAVLSEDARVILHIPPGGMQKDQRIELTDLSSSLEVEPDPVWETLAGFRAEPDGLTFLKPAEVEFPLSRWIEPGTVLPLSVRTAGGWEEVTTATVLPDGLRAKGWLPHFSEWSIRRRLETGPTLPVTPAISSLTPSVLREGELRPFLVQGLGFSGVRAVTIREMDGTVARSMAVRSFMFSAGAPRELGVLIKSLPNPALRAGNSASYRLRLTSASGGFHEVTFNVTGLNEFDVPPAGSFVIPETPLTNRALFSRIRIGLLANVTNFARVLAWQATDEVTVGGNIHAGGTHGAAGTFTLAGRMAEPQRTLGGAGDGATANPPARVQASGSPGTPALVANLNDYLPGTLNRIYGQPGQSGVAPAGFDLAALTSPLAAVSEGMYALFETRMVEALPGRNNFDFNLRREISEDLTLQHPEGRKGQQGRPGGFRPRSQWYGFHFGTRIIEPGGGGGGGGASFRAFHNPATGSFGAGLSGGSGGGGGSAVSLAAGGTLTLAEFSSVITAGGNGGDGSDPGDMQDPAAIGRGGGGGPGGAGTIHLLGGELLRDGSRGLSLTNLAGTWGQGGFLMTVGTHVQATPRAWLEPVEQLRAPSQSEVAGPDFSSGGRGIATSIRTGRAVEALALNPRFQEISVRVQNRLGDSTFFLKGLGDNCRTVRLLLTPGLNTLQINQNSDHAVLNREIVVLNTPDTDGDGLADTEEADLGFNPALADTDGDGLSDSAEWLNGGRAAPGDSDGDGVPDLVEINSGSNAFDPNSTPWNANIGTPAGRGVIIASPSAVNVVVPYFQCGPGTSWSGVSQSSVRLNIIRPAVGCDTGVPFGTPLANRHTP